MRLTGIQPGDLVQVDDGLPYYAEVVHVTAGCRMSIGLAPVRVRPITGPRGERQVTAREVVAHWRRTGRVRCADATGTASREAG